MEKTSPNPALLLLECPFATLNYEEIVNKYKANQKWIEKNGVLSTFDKKIASINTSTCEPDALKAIKASLDELIVSVETMQEKIDQNYAEIYTRASHQRDQLAQLEFWPKTLCTSAAASCNCSSDCPAYNQRDLGQHLLYRLVLDHCIRFNLTKTARAIVNGPAIKLPKKRFQDSPCPNPNTTSNTAGSACDIIGDVMDGEMNRNAYTHAVSVLCDLEYQTIFQALKTNYSLGTAMSWCAKHKSRLTKAKSRLELSLKIQEHVEFLKSSSAIGSGPKKALQLLDARNYVASQLFAEMPQLEEDIQQLSLEQGAASRNLRAQLRHAAGLMIFRPNTPIRALSDFYSLSQWPLLAMQFQAERLRTRNFLTLSANTSEAHEEPSCLATHKKHKKNEEARKLENEPTDFKLTSEIHPRNYSLLLLILQIGLTALKTKACPSSSSFFPVAASPSKKLDACPLCMRMDRSLFPRAFVRGIGPIESGVAASVQTRLGEDLPVNAVTRTRIYCRVTRQVMMGQLCVKETEEGYMFSGDNGISVMRPRSKVDLGADVEESGLETVRMENHPWLLPNGRVYSKLGVEILCSIHDQNTDPAAPMEGDPCSLSHENHVHDLFQCPETQEIFCKDQLKRIYLI